MQSCWDTYKYTHCGSHYIEGHSRSTGLAYTYTDYTDYICKSRIHDVTFYTVIRGHVEICISDNVHCASFDVWVQDLGARHVGARYGCVDCGGH